MVRAQLIDPITGELFCDFRVQIYGILSNEKKMKKTSFFSLIFVFSSLLFETTDHVDCIYEEVYQAMYAIVCAISFCCAVCFLTAFALRRFFVSEVKKINEKKKEVFFLLFLYLLQFFPLHLNQRIPVIMNGRIGAVDLVIFGGTLFGTGEIKPPLFHFVLFLFLF